MNSKLQFASSNEGKLLHNLFIRCSAWEARRLQNNRSEAIISRLRCFWMFVRQAFLSLIDFISEWTFIYFVRFIRTYKTQLIKIK